MSYDRMSYQFGSIVLVLIDDIPRELLALNFEEISCEWSLIESAFTIEHVQIDDMTVGRWVPFLFVFFILFFDPMVWLYLKIPVTSPSNDIELLLLNYFLELYFDLYF